MDHTIRRTINRRQPPARPLPTTSSIPPNHQEDQARAQDTAPPRRILVSEKALNSSLGKRIANSSFVGADKVTVDKVVANTVAPPSREQDTSKFPLPHRPPPIRPGGVSKVSPYAPENDRSAVDRGMSSANATKHSVLNAVQDEEPEHDADPDVNFAKSKPQRRATALKGDDEQSLGALARLLFSSTHDISLGDATITNRHERVALPSNFVFYDFDELFMRPLDPIDLARLHVARINNDDELFNDVIGATLFGDNVNIRDLAIQDKNFLLYQQRFQSFTTIPYTFTWPSRYGNTNEYTLTETNMTTNLLNMTCEEYQQILADGYCIPTVRDEEIIRTEDFSTLDETEREGIKWLFNRAQYINAPTYAEKIRILNERGSAAFDYIKHLVPRLDFGIVETVTLSDMHFDPDKAMAYLRRQVEERSFVLATNPPANIGVNLLSDIAQLNEEINRISALLTNNEQEVVSAAQEDRLPVLTVIEPLPETIRLSVSIHSFFPDI